MRNRVVALLLCGIAFLAACNSNGNGTAPEPTAQIQFVNASSSTAAVNVLFNNQQLQTNLNFLGFNTQCVNVPAGSQTFTFTSGGSTVATSAFNFEAGKHYTVILFGTGTARSVVVRDETFTAPSSGNIAVRFINASSTGGDIYATTPTGAVTAPPLLSNLASGQVTGMGGNAGTVPFLSIPSANTRVRLFDVGVTTGTPRSDITLSGIPSSGATTVVFVQSTGAGAQTVFQMNQCHT